MKLQPLTLSAEPGATPITHAQLVYFIGVDSINKSERRLESKHFGPWHICTSITGLAVSAEWTDERYGSRHVKTYTLHGDRTMSRPRECGYEMEGYVSIDGKKRSAFTSSVMFQLPDGKLINVSCLHVRTK